MFTCSTNLSINNQHIKMSAMQTCAVLENAGHKSKGFIEKYFPRLWPFVKLMRINQHVVPITLYPVSKCFIAFPSITFGMIANWGTLIGWYAVRQNLDISVCCPLYFGAICWTVVYDTIYGSQDKKDDVHYIHSTVLTFGSYSRALIILGIGAEMGAITGLSLAGAVAKMGWPYYLGMLVATMHLGNLIFTVDLENPSDCGKKYSDNVMFGFLVFLAMLAGNYSLFHYSMAAMLA